MKIELSLNKSLDIIADGKIIYSITPGSVLGTVGSKHISYKMSHGSFRIKEKTEFETDWRVESILPRNEGFLLKMNIGACSVGVEDFKRLRFTPSVSGKMNFMRLRLPSEPSEGFYGGGEVFSEFNLKGHKLDVWVAEHINIRSTVDKMIQRSIGAKDKTFKKRLSVYESYYAQPTFLSSKKYFFHSETTARSVFDFSRGDFSLIETDSIAPFYFGFADDFEDLMSNLTELTGRQPSLPEWVFDGQILGVQGGTDVMMSKLQTALNTGAEVCGVWIQDWEGRRVTAVGKQLFWNWEWDRELYPGLDVKIRELKENGIRVLGYCNPFLAVEKPLYKYAHERGYCVKDADGKDYMVKITTFPAAMVDFTNPEARQWIKDIIKQNMIGFGLSGWMADFGEYLPTDAVLYSGENAELVHNTWQAQWAQINREAVEECGKLGEIMFFTRAGFTGTPAASTMMWNGDNHVDFSRDYGLASVIPASLCLVCCGFGLSHSDIGGYTTFGNLRRSKELYMRWCEMNAFSLLMRGHEGLNPDLNVQFDYDEEVLAHGAKMSRIHKKLKPYLAELVEQNAHTGVGVVRPLFFYYDDEHSKNEKFEYLLGRDVLVAPVIDPGAKTKKAFLPEDKWVHIWTGDEFSGGEVTVDAPLGKPPVFVRKNAAPGVRLMFEGLKQI